MHSFSSLIGNKSFSDVYNNTQQGRQKLLLEKTILPVSPETSIVNNHASYCSYPSSASRALVTGVECAWQRSVKRCSASSRYRQSRSHEYFTETRGIKCRINFTMNGAHSYPRHTFPLITVESRRSAFRFRFRKYVKISFARNRCSQMLHAWNPF